MTDSAAMQAAAAITGGQAMARQLVAEGVTHVFGIPGIQLDYASNGLSGVSDTITFINARHEQTTTYAADGYSRTTGRIGVAMVVPGPGMLNAASGLVTALANWSRVLLISGQIPTRTIGRGLGMLHEIPDQSGILASLCRSATIAEDPDQVAGLLHGAMVQLGQGAGPVAVEIPPDVLSARTDGPAIGAEAPGTPPPGDAADLAAAAERLVAAERPLIYVGGGAVGAGTWTELTDLATTLGAPVVASVNGKGAFDESHPMAFLPLEARELLMRADTVLFVGSRAVDGRGGAMPQTADGTTLIGLNNDPNAFTPPRNYDVSILGDARTGTQALLDLLDGERAPWLTDAEDVRARVRDDMAPLAPQTSYSTALRDAMPDDAVLINELTQVGYIARYTFDVRHPRSYVGSGYQCTLGFGYPTAIGAAVGNPDRPVVSINGDGGFGYGLAELATVAHYDIPLVGVVFRDDAYGNVQRMQREAFDGDSLGTELTNPDMLALAASFGITGYRAESPEEFRTMLGTAIDAREPSLIDVPLGVLPDPWRIVMRPWQPPAAS
ncbi:MAG: thiamine pyrophosphate-dependent enzyme [Actinomycetota bacterium]